MGSGADHIILSEVTKPSPDWRVLIIACLRSFWNTASELAVLFKGPIRSVLFTMGQWVGAANDGLPDPHVDMASVESSPNCTVPLKCNCGPKANSR